MPDPEINKIDEKLGHAIMQFNNLHHFNRKHDAECEEIHRKDQQYNLKYSEYLLLFSIGLLSKNNPEGATASELSTSLHVKPPTINPLLSNLERLALIVRKPDKNDRRFVRILLSEEGADFTEKHKAHFLKKVHGLTGYLGEQKTADLIDMLNDVYAYLKSIQQR